MDSCSLQLETRLAIIQSLQIVGGATESIFPQAEALLLGNEDYQHALEYVAARKNMERYQSMMDFLFCEIHFWWRADCFRFYEGKGPQLKEQITPQQLVRFNERLLKALEVAYRVFYERRCKSWEWFREQVEAAIKRAA